MTTYLNAVAERFGFAYGYDATYEMSTGSLQQYIPPPMLRHPSIIHLPNRFLFGTSCSLRPAWTSRVSICGYDLRALYLDYSRRSFFPEGHIEASMDFGWIAQGIAQRVGRGRVAAFTDSTIFSNFWYFMPGKNELFTGTLEWLNRTNSRWYTLAFWTVLAGAAGLVVVARRRAVKGLMGRSAWLAAVVGGGVGLNAGDHANQRTYAWPPTDDPPVVIGFDRRYSDLNIPAYELPGGQRSFHTFYTWVQRLDIVPSAAEDFFGRLGDLDALVMVFPRRVPTPRDLMTLDRWLNEGGTAVVLDGVSNPSPAANEWLDRYGLRFDYNGVLAGSIEDLDGTKWTSASGIRVHGGQPFLYVVQPAPPPPIPLRPPEDPDEAVVKTAVGTFVRVGAGRLLLLGVADSFQDTVMGSTRVVPTDQQLELYELEYALLRAIIGRAGEKVVPLPGDSSR